MNNVDITRHVEIFSRDAFGNKRIDVMTGKEVSN